jgi:hypothetical protein
MVGWIARFLLCEAESVVDPNLAKIIDSKALDDISFTRIDIIESRSR